MRSLHYFLAAFNDPRFSKFVFNEPMVNSETQNEITGYKLITEFPELLNDHFLTSVDNGLVKIS